MARPRASDRRRRQVILAAAAALGAAIAFVAVRAARGPGEHRAPVQQASIRVAYVQHAGADRGRAVGDIIREEAARARDSGARLAFVMEWPAPFGTWEAWQAADPAVARISKEAFLKLEPEAAASDGREPEARALFDAWVRWRDAAVQSVQATRSIGRADADFGAEVDRGLRDAGDVLTDVYIEGSHQTGGVDAAERERRDWQLFVTWSQGYRNFLYAQLCENNQILQALDEGDPGRFHVRAREGLRVHREALRRRNEVMAATLGWIVRSGTPTRPVRIVLFFGLAHAFAPTLKEALGDIVVETMISPRCGKYENTLEIYRDPDGFERRGDGADPDRYVLSTQVTAPAELENPDFIRARDDVLAILTSADIDAVIRGMRGIRSLAPPARTERLRRALGERLLEAHSSPEDQGRARRYLARIGASPDRTASAPASRDAASIEREIAIARELQGRGTHEEACARLGRAFEHVVQMAPRAETALMRTAGIDLARSLIALGRRGAAEPVLASVRTRFPSTRQAAQATVLLQQGGAGLDSYRGKYDGDAAHRDRMSAVVRAVPRARTRLAAALGVGEDLLPEALVGVADRPAEVGVEKAITEGDPRRPHFAPIVIMFSEALALDLEDLETTLVHELGHAYFIAEAGLTYEAMPPWATEGLSHALAGEFDRIADDLAWIGLIDDPEGFTGSEAAEKLSHLFDTAENAGGRFGSGLLLALLEHRFGPVGLSRFAHEVAGGATLESALRSVAGLTTSEFVAAAKAHAVGMLLSRRQQSLADLQALDLARKAGVTPALFEAQAALDRPRPRLVAGYARVMMAEALESLGRPADSATAWQVFLRDRHQFPSLVHDALLSLGRNLLAAGRIPDGRAVLESLRRDALIPAYAHSADELLSRFPAFPERR